MNCFYILPSVYKKAAASLAFLLFFCLKSYATLVCPPNQTISTQPSACIGELDFSSLAWSSTNPLTDTVFMPGPGYAFPKGNTLVMLYATEVGGNVPNCDFTVTVVDEEAPVANCKDNIVIELPQIGLEDIWAADFDNGSHDNCSSLLNFSFSPDVDDIGETLGCYNLGSNPLVVWVTDVDGNQGFCNTVVILQQNISTCEPTDILGRITNEDNVAAENFLVTSSIGDYSTDANGIYYLGGYYTLPSTEIIPNNDIDPANGVTTFDVVLIRKHILGNVLLGSPYKIIAADANHSNSVTTFDLVVITKVILGNAPNFQNNTSWRFVPAYYHFPNPLNPFLEDFPETIALSPNSGIYYFDFIAIKVGDVNNSAAPNFAEGGTEKFQQPPNETLNRH